MRSQFALRFALLLSIKVLLANDIAHAANSSWNTPASGDFGDPVNWTSGVPGPTDTATFDAGGSYTVTFDNSPNPLNSVVQNQDLNVANPGTVTFVSGADGPYTYHLTGSGNNDVQVTEGTFILGTTNFPLHLTADDDIVLRGHSSLLVTAGSQVNAADLLLGTVASEGNGTVIVDGDSGPSSLNISGDIVLGQNGSDGTLTYRNGAQGSLGTVRVGVDASASGGTQGTLVAENGADLLVGNVLIGTGTTSSATGSFNVGNIGSTVQHTASSSLTIGNANPSFGISGSLNLQFGTAYIVGTGTTTIRGQGVLQLDGGTFTTSGSVHVNDVGDPGFSARIDLNGQSQFVQSGSVEVVVGGASGGASLITLDSSSATFTTGTGLLTINKTGTLDINNGTFNANGNVLINGGTSIERAEERLLWPQGR